MPELTYTETLVVRHCWCGIAHAIPSNLSRRADEEGVPVWCPLGHEWFISETEIKKLRKRLEREEQRRRAAQDLLAAEERSHAATRGHLTRTKKRIANGVCPCCHRHFVNVERHMKSKHPDYVEAPA